MGCYRKQNKKKNTTSHPNIVSLRTAIDEKWNKMFEEFILKACKLFQRHLDTIIEKTMVAILSKFTVFVSIFLFCHLFFRIKCNLIL